VATIEFTQEASIDVGDAVAWYKRQAPGIEEKFLAELDVIETRIAANPLQFPMA